MAGGGDVGGGLPGGLLQLSYLVQGVYAQACERHNLTPAQAKLLCIVMEHPRGMADLADLLGVEKAALTGLVDRVERRGLARRAAVPGDRRALQVTLTTTGQQAAAAFSREVTGQLSGLTAELPDTERKRLQHSIARIIGAHNVRPAIGIIDAKPDR